MKDKAVHSTEDARNIARGWAHELGKDKAKAELYAETWFGATKDQDALLEQDLISNLRQRFDAPES